MLGDLQSCAALFCMGLRVSAKFGVPCVPLGYTIFCVPENL